MLLLLSPSKLFCICIVTFSIFLSSAAKNKNKIIARIKIWLLEESARRNFGYKKVKICATPDAPLITPIPSPFCESAQNSSISSTPPSHKKLCKYPLIPHKIIARYHWSVNDTKIFNRQELAAPKMTDFFPLAFINAKKSIGKRCDTISFQIRKAV